jgi:hypothetical protein
MPKDPRSEEGTVWESIEAFTCMDGSTPIVVGRGERVRGGPNSIAFRFAKFFVPDGSLRDEIHRARHAAGIGQYAP